MLSPPQVIGAGFVSMLKPLKLRSLNISNSGIRDFSELRRQTHLETLIARNVPVYDEREAVYRLANLKLKKLVLSEGMFSDKQLKRLRKSLEVEVLPTAIPDSR
jgi:hypothetical protein